MNAAQSWIRDRISGAPEALLEAMLSAAGSNAVPAPSECLAEAAITLYEHVLAGSGNRDDALTLLAADALFTHAFEAQAEADPAAVGDFAARWSGSRRVGRISLGGSPSS